MSHIWKWFTFNWPCLSYDLLTRGQENTVQLQVPEEENTAISEH